MLLRGMIRWHTFRIMLLTSLVWVIFGVCLLVYYMECLAFTSNTINCKPKSDSNSLNANNRDISDDSNDYLNANHIQSDSDSDNNFKVNSHHKREGNSFLPQYKSEQLNSWRPNGMCEDIHMNHI